MKKHVFKTSLILSLLVAFSTTVFAQEGKKHYSPNVGKKFPNSVYFGDTHLHTGYSTDAGMVGCTLGPEDAYRIALGEAVRAEQASVAHFSDVFSRFSDSNYRHFNIRALSGALRPIPRAKKALENIAGPLHRPQFSAKPHRRKDFFNGLLRRRWSWSGR